MAYVPRGLTAACPGLMFRGRVPAGAGRLALAGGPRRPLRYRRALGATRRVADQLRPALTVEVCDRPAVGAASPISLGST